jgi:aspartyl-tRNA(Asn)/glutamyl-tRNA(Gln) amidotransferase subunit A
MTYASAAARIVQLSEVAALYANHTNAELFGPDVWGLIQQGRLIPASDYVNAQRFRSLLRVDFDRLWTTVDVVLTPTTPMAAPLLDEAKVMIAGKEEDTRMAATRLVRSINLLGEPALSLPCGKSTAGLPIGLQIIAAPFEEPKLLQFARTLEERLSSFF